MKQAKVWVWLFALTLLVLSVWRSGAHIFAREAVYPYANARVWIEHNIWTRAKAVALRSRVGARNAQLERDVARLRIMSQEREALEAEVRRLRALLDFAPGAEHLWIAAPVCSRGGVLGIDHTICIGKGSFHGVRRGDPVIVPDGVVGRVGKVSPHTSEIMLITDPNSRISCVLETPGMDVGAVRGILYGNGTRSVGTPGLSLLYVVEPLRLRYMERDFEPSPRARVVTSGMGQTFPKGLPVGYLLDSKVDENGLLREGGVMPSADISSIDEVFVLSRERRPHAR